jgi:hypothetical protein
VDLKIPEEAPTDPYVCPKGLKRDPFIIVGIVPYAQVRDHDGKLLASELARKRFIFFARKQGKKKFLS